MNYFSYQPHTGDKFMYFSHTLQLFVFRLLGLLCRPGKYFNAKHVHKKIPNKAMRKACKNQLKIKNQWKLQQTLHSRQSTSKKLLTSYIKSFCEIMR